MLNYQRVRQMVTGGIYIITFQFNYIKQWIWLIGLPFLTKAHAQWYANPPLHFDLLATILCLECIGWCVNMLYFPLDSLEVEGGKWKPSCLRSSGRKYDTSIYIFPSDLLCNHKVAPPPGNMSWLTKKNPSTHLPQTSRNPIYIYVYM